MIPDASQDATPDEALLAAMALGDETAGLAFVRRYQRRVYGLALSVLNDATAAEDVAQEAFLRAWKHASVFDHRRGAVATWLLTITRNLAIDAVRARRSVPVGPDDLVWMRLASGERSVEESVVVADSTDRLHVALAELPAEQRRAVALAGIYGRTAAEVAAHEQIPLGTAKTRIRAGITKLRAALAMEAS
ncbi:MAG: hypothetical protein JWM85_1833 [Acidimicrobiaceae bacterium]|nr:hypothetical protein [Acidimicrobiaceae bacterium]